MIKPLRLGVLAGLIAAAAAGVSLAAPERPTARLRPPDAPRDPVIAFEKYKLANGLEVILAQDNSVPLVAVSVWYHVASGNEVPGKSGFAHLFEHMLFQGSKHVGSDRHFDILRAVGASIINGTTNTDRTNYFEVVPSNQLDTALWMESDRMGYLLPVFTDASLQNQIEVVRNERRQSYETQPYGTAYLATFEALYPGGHPYKHTTIGKHEDLASASKKDVTDFFKTWYVPANATLTIAGDFDVAAARASVEKFFGTFPTSQKPVTRSVPAPVMQSRSIDVTDKVAKLSQISWDWHGPARFAPDDAELAIAADVLGRTGTGRLYRALVHEKQLAQNVTADQDGMGFSGVFDISVTLRTGADVAEVKKIVAAELQRLRTEPISEAELRRVVVAKEAASIRGLESLLSRAEALQVYNHYLGDPGRLTWDLDRFRKATPESVRAAVEKYLRDDRRLEVMVTPAPGGSK